MWRASGTRPTAGLLTECARSSLSARARLSGGALLDPRPAVIISRMFRRMTRVVAAHPVITAVLLVCTVAGAAAGVVFMGDDWSLTRRLIGGAVAGAGAGLIVTATRMTGAWE